jgi:hypothetical protein
MQKNVKQQISKIVPSSVYIQYTAWCDRARECPIDSDCFRGMFYTIKRKLDIVFRSSKQGSAVCWFCGRLNEIEKTYTSMSEKKWVNDVHMEHLSFHQEETKLYEARCWEAKDELNNVLSMNADGADAHSHNLPQVEGRSPKNLPEWRQKLQGVIVHGKTLFIYNLSFLVQPGANMMLTTLLRSLQLTGFVPSKVYLQIDAGPENWNHCVFGIIDLLFDIYSELNEFYVSRFAVGHTHADLDRFLVILINV